MTEQVRVLVVDDSYFMRKLISDMLDHPSIRVVGTAKSGEEALRKTVELRPDVITLDVQLTDTDGLTVLRTIMAEYPTPVIMLSALTSKDSEITLEALRSGAVDFVQKPSGEISMDISKLKNSLLDKVEAAAQIKATKIRRLMEKKRIKLKAARGLRQKVVVIGASTGGPPALEAILTELPPDLPAAFIIVQHITKPFTRLMAVSLDKYCSIKVREAKEGDLIEPGWALIAPADYHLKVEQEGIEGRIKNVVSLNQGPPVQGFRPNIDAAMQSVAKAFSENAIGVILTGMGEDGAEGMRAIKQRNGRTIVQDEQSSLIFGMPKVVIDQGNADEVRSLPEIAQAIIQMLGT